MPLLDKNMTALVWFRQDLRLTDNPALYHASQESDNIILLYVLDESTPWPIGKAQRWWLHHSLHELKKQLKKDNITLTLKRGDAHHIILATCEQHHVSFMYWNRCYEPFSIERDTNIKNDLKSKGINVHSYNGSLLHEPWDILNKQGTYFKVFTPFWKTCCLTSVDTRILPKPKIKQKIVVAGDAIDDWNLLPTKPDWSTGFKQWHPGELQAQKQLNDFITERLQQYSHGRDFPALHTNSRLSPYLHFGEISPKQIWHTIKSLSVHEPHLENPAEYFLRELGWREFSYYLLYHFPSLPHENFKKEFDHFKWSHDMSRLSAWQKGETGYPIVDAGMRELWHTGYMHNRVRMIAASFLVKDLFIDWRHGATWFWDTLLDADLANNSMGWQWVAGSGADAAPYFRIFNPTLQSKKFDPQNDYINRWIPNLNNYPAPVVNHDKMRQLALEYYKKLK